MFSAAWSTIIGLLFGSSPFAIFWAVIAIVVYSFQHHFGIGAFTQIFKEFSEILSPFSTYFYASATVVIPIFICGQLTTLYHSRPNSILWESLPSFSVGSMFKSATAALFQFPQETATTPNVSIFKIVPLNIFDGSAVTETNPINMLSGNLLWPFLISHHYKQASESLSSKVFEWWHRSIIHQGITHGDR